MDTVVSVAEGTHRVRLWSAGSGDALLYLHGVDGPVGETEFLTRLAERRRVVAPETPGYGESTDIEQLDDMLDVTLYHRALLDELGIEQVDVVGHALGGMFAAELAAIDPHVVRRLVLVSPFGLWLDDAPVPDFFTMSDRALGRAQWFDPEARQTALAAAPPASPRAAQLELIARTKNLSAAGKFLWPIPDRGLVKRLSRIKAPALLIRGERDGLISQRYAEEFCRRMPNCRLAVIGGAAHLPMLEQPDAFVSVVEQFLSEG